MSEGGGDGGVPAGGLSYRDAGVDLEAAERAKEGLKELVASTRDGRTLSEMGLFGGLYAVPDDVEAPVLVASADGVGTKLKVAFLSGRHDTVGRDLVNHCVDDVLVQGARPLFFLDYLATGRMDEGVVNEVVRGVALACRENGCALLGGETAEMPDFYAEGEYDLAGFLVGVVSRPRILDGSRVRPGDALVALPSSGLHTNGYTLAREIVFGRMGLGVDDPFPETDGSVADALLRVHRSYLPALGPELDREEGGGTGGAGDRPGRGSEPEAAAPGPRLHALAHVTGGGIPGNLPRVLPERCGAVVEAASWEVPPLFRVLEREGGVAREEMFRAFNMGVGMIAVVAADEADAFLGDLRARGEDAWVLGEVVEGEGVRFA